MDKSQIVDKFKNVLGVKEKLNVSYAALAPKKNGAGVGKDSKIKCSKCYFRSTSNESLKRHMKEVHCREDLLSCPTCDYTASDENILNYHMESHPDVKRHKCPYCEFLTTSKINFEVHTIKCHLKRYYFCKRCDFGTFDPDEFSAHKLIHPPPPTPRTVYRSGNTEKFHFITRDGIKNENNVTKESVLNIANDLKKDGMVCQKTGPSQYTFNKIKVICQISSNHKIMYQPPTSSNSNGKENEQCDNSDNKIPFKRSLASPLPFQSNIYCIKPVTSVDHTIDTSLNVLNDASPEYTNSTPKRDVDGLNELDGTSLAGMKVTGERYANGKEGFSPTRINCVTSLKNNQCDGKQLDVTSVADTCKHSSSASILPKSTCIDLGDSCISTSAGIAMLNDKVETSKSEVIDMCYNGNWKKGGQSTHQETYNNNNATIFSDQDFDEVNINDSNLETTLFDIDDNINEEKDLAICKISSSDAKNFCDKNIEDSMYTSSNTSQNINQNQGSDEDTFKEYFENSGLLNGKRSSEKGGGIKSHVVNVSKSRSTNQCLSNELYGIDFKGKADTRSILDSDRSNITFKSTEPSLGTSRFPVKDSALLKTNVEKEGMGRLKSTRLDKLAGNSANPNGCLFEELIETINLEDDMISWNNSIELCDLDIIPDLLSDHELEDFNSCEMQLTDNILSSFFNEEDKPSSASGSIELKDPELDDAPSDSAQFLSDFIETIDFEESSMNFQAGSLETNCCSLNLIDMVNHEDNYLNCLTDSKNRMHCLGWDHKSEKHLRNSSKISMKRSCFDHKDDFLLFNTDAINPTGKFSGMGMSDSLKSTKNPVSSEVDNEQTSKRTSMETTPSNDIMEIDKHVDDQDNLNSSSTLRETVAGSNVNGSSMKFGQMINSAPAFQVCFNAFNGIIEPPGTKDGSYPLVLST